MLCQGAGLHHQLKLGFIKERAFLLGEVNFQSALSDRSEGRVRYNKGGGGGAILLAT